MSLSEADLSISASCPHCGSDVSPSSASVESGVEAVGPSAGPSISSPGPPVAPPSLIDGSSFGRYRIVRILGRGGMGAVYLANDTRLDRPVALKIPHLADKAELLERFHREARAAAALDHPNLCPIYDVGEVDGTPYLTMAYVEGRPLSDLMGRSEWPPRQVAAVIRKLALALQAAHDRGVVHRDLKPANVLVSRRRELMVVDFGLARRDGAGDARLTQSGIILGTPTYMAPEQVSGDATAGPSCDIYALGVILYEMLCDRPPFEGPVALVLGQVMMVEPEPPSSRRPGVDPRLEAICLRALSKKAADRQPSMRALADELSEFLRGDEVPQLPSPADAPSASPSSPRTTGGESLVANFFASLKTESAPASSPEVAISPAAPEAEPEVAPNSIPPRRWSRRRLAASLVPLLGLLGVILYVATDNGEVMIELIDPKTEVTVKVDGKTIDLKGLGQPIRIRVGDHRLEYEAKGFEGKGESFAIKRGERYIARVQLVAKAPAVATTTPGRPAAGADVTPKTHAEVANSPAGSAVAPKVGDLDRLLAYDDRIAEALQSLKKKDAGHASQILAGCPTDVRGWEWHYLQRLCEMNPASIEGTRPADAGFRDEAVLTIDEPEGPSSVSFSPDGSRIAYSTWGWDPGLVLLDASGKEIARRGRWDKMRDNSIHDISFSPDGKWIGSVGVNGSVQVWDAETLEQVRSFPGHEGIVNSVAFAPDGRWMATGGDDETVRIWPLKPGKESLTCY